MELAWTIRRRIEHNKSEFALVPTGKVKWFNVTKGYGFIVPDDGGKDLFVHITAVQKAGYTNLVEGVRVSYEIRPDREGHPTAENLKLGIGMPPGDGDG